MMQSNLTKNIKKIKNALNKVKKLPKKIMKYGFIAFLVLFAIGAAMVILNRTRIDFDPYIEFSATTLIKNSFIILAESIIGGLLIDFIFKKE